jgi:hypothetical protein
MARYKGYYWKLNMSMESEMLSYKDVIVKDINRTGSKDLSDGKREAMLRILYSFAKRNMEIGYCQGMNFICFYLLEMGFSEEQAFWMICYIFEQLMPSNYYISMIPIVADICILRILMEECLPQTMKQLNYLQVDLNLMMLPLFVTAFTNLKNFEVG